MSSRFASDPAVRLCCVAVWGKRSSPGNSGAGRCPWSVKALCSLDADYLSEKYNENDNMNRIKQFEHNKLVTLMKEINDLNTISIQKDFLIMRLIR